MSNNRRRPSRSVQFVSPRLLWTVYCCLAICALRGCGQSGSSTVDDCDVSVRVSGREGMNCSELLQQGESLDSQICSSLQVVLDSIARNQTTHGLSGCVQVYLASGDHVITDSIVISQSIVLIGEYDPSSSTPCQEEAPPPTNGAPPIPTEDQTTPTPGPPGDPTEATVSPSQCDPVVNQWSVRVTFEVDEAVNFAGSTDPYYVVSFANSERVEMSGVSFSNSVGILGFDNISSVTIVNCSFSYFDQGAVDVYNCPSVAVSNCYFAHNSPADVLKQEQYRGHSPALSIGYNTDSILTPLVTITGSTFFNNTASPAISSTFSTTQVLVQQRFPGRGGGIAVIVNSPQPADILIDNCTLEQNYAQSFGAGMYSLLDGLSNHVIVVNRTRFVKNVTPGDAGGLIIVFLEDETSAKQANVVDSVFVDNEASFGGGASFVLLDDVDGQVDNVVSFDNCVFERNKASEVGAAFVAGTFFIFVSRENTRPLAFTNCAFIDNKAPSGGVVTAAYFPLGFYGNNNTFQDNRGPGLVVVGAVVNIFGSLLFTANDNNALDGGALYVISFGQVELHPGASLTFQDNKGAIGASIVVETRNVPRVFSRLLHNPLCFLLFKESTVPPTEWEKFNVSIGFHGNQGLVGSAVYLDRIDLCSWFQNSDPYFDPDGIFRWSFINFTTNFNDAHGPDNLTDPLWYVQTQARQFNVTNEGVTAYAGERIQLMIEVLDEFDQPTATVLRATDLSTASSEGTPTGIEVFRFDPSIIVLDRQLQETVSNISFVQLDDVFRTESITLETIVEGETIRDSIMVSARPCAAGYRLQPTTVGGGDYFVCTCNLDNPGVVNCDDRNIILKDGLWGTIDTALLGQNEDLLVTYPCPHGYCRCFVRTVAGPMTCAFVLNNQNFDRQCACDREGELCGDCRDGQGVSALLNKCTSCSNAFGVLIAGLVIVDLLVFLLLLVVMTPVPSWLYPCLFYLQVLPYMTEYFPVTFDKFRPYLYYVSSALGLYFPFDACLYDSMPALVSHTIRLLPFFTAVFLCPAVLLVRQYKFHPVPWHGLWWIILLLFTPLVHTALSLLNCPIIPGRDGSHVPRWFLNANVKCFSHAGHAPLGLLAILLLGICLIIIAMATLCAMEKIKHPSWVHHLVGPLTHVYQEMFCWWGGVELTRRMLLLLFIVAFPNNDYPAIFILCVILVVFGLVQPYKEPYTAVLEVFLAGDVLIMLLLRNTIQLKEEWQSIPKQSGPRGGSGGCDDEVEGVTTMAWVLAIFYYIPLLVSVVLATAWIALRLRNPAVKRCRSLWKKQPVDLGGLELERGGSTLRSPIGQRTTTIVSLADLDPSTPLTTPTVVSPRSKGAKRAASKKRGSKFSKSHDVVEKVFSWPAVKGAEEKTKALPDVSQSVPSSNIIPSIETVV